MCAKASRDNVQLFLTRRNLLALLEKLDHVADGGDSACSIIKSDTEHPTHPMTGVSSVMVTAVEDSDYYQDRTPGDVLDMKTKRVK